MRYLKLVFGVFLILGGLGELLRILNLYLAGERPIGAELGVVGFLLGGVMVIRSAFKQNKSNKS